MSTSTYFILIALVAVLVHSLGGASSTTALFVVCAAVLLAIPLYFSTRDHSRAPSHVEQVAATLWLWLCRLLGVGAGSAMVAGGLYVAATGGFAKGALDRWLMAGFCLLLGVFFIYVGIVGQGPDRHQWHDDVEQHKRNRRRYGWRS